jgi:uncharacterized membrane protein YvbJ
MFCKDCGFELPNNSVACSSCGKLFAAKIQVNQQTTNVIKNDSLNVNPVLAIIFITIFAVAGWVWYSKYYYSEQKPERIESIEINADVKIK